MANNIVVTGLVSNTFKMEDNKVCINGSLILVKYLNATTSDTTILLPPAPTVLPYDATLTQQQIDSGVIKHADSSNSGLITNGKFDTDTSGWTHSTNTTFSSVAGKAVLATSTGGSGIYPWSTVPTQALVAGKKYIIEIGGGVTRVTGSAIRVAIGTVQPSSNLQPQSTVMFYNSLINIPANTVFEYTATSSAIHYVSIYQQDGITANEINFGNIAVFPSDAISRSDLVFLESDDYVDVSVNDFVYPLGNKQYLGTTGDCGTTVVGSFAGSSTYSLFSDVWQAGGALVGRGYVWSTLSDVNKKLFVANPENNCYLDGNKVIQVQYKIRVEQGDSDTPLMSSYGFSVDTTKDAGLWYK